MNEIKIYSIYFLFIFISASVLSGIVNFIWNRFRIRHFNRAARFFGYLAVLCLILYILYIFYSAFFGTIIILYTVLYSIFAWFFHVPQAATFLSLFVTLLIIAYIPEKLGYYFFRFIEIYINKTSHLSEKYIFVVRFLRLKLWIYMFSFAILLISSLETYTNSVFIHNAAWQEFRPVILQAIVTFIAFDRFINLLSGYLPGIKQDITNLKSYINKMFSSYDEKSVNKS